jgi:hypothetical protein
MKCIAVMAGQDTAPDENLFKQIKGIQCVEGCQAHYWLYVPPDMPVGSIEEIRVRARAICRDFHHPLHPTRFELEA